MDFDSRGHSIHDHETPEMWCSRICNPFRKILEENPRILSKNGYIIMYGNLIERSDRVYSLPTNYIYCSVCDSLVFISENGLGGHPITYRDNHLKRCISGNSISNEHARRKEILKSIDDREFHIWQYKQFILREETKINRLRLELFSQSTSHSEKDKLASVSYDNDARLTDYKIYAQSKPNIAKNTIPSAPNFEPAYIPATKKWFRQFHINHRIAKVIQVKYLSRLVIQRAYRNYKKRPESLAKRIWEVVRNNGTPDRWKYLGINNESIQPGYIGYICYRYEGHCYPVRNDWMFEKRAQLWK
ncbi:hypothetical protein RhiirA4_475406 [Rhizophagus irregularis]|uniref:Uncharacterized protein n=1 Tax=Rhizophagus irregularis TaxID=588596 RepID=A0A2I1HA66_9GLOM|nr:hypothetical protein RhiirA4_475406 [Rhizophagus irregularis]